MVFEIGPDEGEIVLFNESSDQFYYDHLIDILSHFMVIFPFSKCFEKDEQAQNPQR